MDASMTEHLNNRMIGLGADLAQLTEANIDEATCTSIEIRCRELERVTRRMKLRLTFEREQGAAERRRNLKVVTGGAA